MQEKISRLSWATDVTESTIDKVDQQDKFASVQKLIKLHIKKQQDVHTNLFCFAASHGDVGTIEAMMDQGFDSNSSDCEHYIYIYKFDFSIHVISFLSQINMHCVILIDNNVTALMVASRKGCVEVGKNTNVFVFAYCMHKLIIAHFTTFKQSEQLKSSWSMVLIQTQRMCMETAQYTKPRRTLMMMLLKFF